MAELLWCGAANICSLFSCCLQRHGSSAADRRARTTPIRTGAPRKGCLARDLRWSAFAAVASEMKPGGLRGRAWPCMHVLPRPSRTSCPQQPPRARSAGAKDCVEGGGRHGVYSCWVRWRSKARHLAAGAARLSLSQSRHCRRRRGSTRQPRRAEAGRDRDLFWGVSGRQIVEAEAKLHRLAAGRCVEGVIWAGRSPPAGGATYCM